MGSRTADCTEVSPAALSYAGSGRSSQQHVLIDIHAFSQGQRSSQYRSTVRHVSPMRFSITQLQCALLCGLLLMAGTGLFVLLCVSVFPVCEASDRDAFCTLVSATDGSKCRLCRPAGCLSSVVPRGSSILLCGHSGRSDMPRSLHIRGRD